MKIHKEIVWNKGTNPKKDGEYLLATFLENGTFATVGRTDYTVAYGWNTCSTCQEYGWGQTPHGAPYMWAELPF